MQLVKMSARALLPVVVVGTLVSGAWAQDADVQKPCSSPEFEQFDFWVGTWRVVDPEGAYQGSNRVEKILGGCVVQENWTGAKGMAGRSYNIYSKSRGTWHQTWVDSNGTLLQLDGGLADGRMVLTGETPARDGTGTVLHEISWQPLDTGEVRQVWRMSKDGGSTWTDAFVGIYTNTDD